MLRQTQAEMTQSSECIEAISFGHFYLENYPKKFREWQTGRWQQDIACRDPSSAPIPSTV